MSDPFADFDFDAKPAEFDLDGDNGTAKQRPASPTALRLDKWGVHRGHELYERNALLRHTMAGHDDALVRDAAADFFAACFEGNPKLAADCRDPDRHAYLSELMETPDYKALHATTMLKPFQAEVAAVDLAVGFMEYQRQVADAQAAVQPAKAAHWSEQPAKQTDEELDTSMIALQAAGDALHRAKESVEEVDETLNALPGCGIGGRGAGSQIDMTKLAKLYKASRNNETLRRIFELAGRYRRLAQARQRSKVLHGQDDVVGVTVDGVIEHMLSEELAKLTDPDLELDVMRRIVERQVMCRDFQGQEPQARGPVVVMLDESGSMTDYGRNYHSKALALALAWIAQHQRRWCGLVAWSDVDTPCRLLSLPPSRWPAGELHTWLSDFLYGSTDLPLAKMLGFFDRLGAPKGKTDIIIITDGRCSFGTDEAESFNLWRAKEKAKVTSIVIDASRGTLDSVSDKVHEIPYLDVDQQAVADVLSL